nr:MAG TPA: hypothetical protein [Caudoviricetes sp.]
MLIKLQIDEYLHIYKKSSQQKLLFIYQKVGEEND